MNDTIFAAEFARELDMEAVSTRKCLERINPEFFNFKPHEKSMEMGYLAVLVAEIPLWIAKMLEDSVIDFATTTHIKPTSAQEIADHFDENLAKAKASLAKVKDGDLDELFYLKANGKTLFSSPKRQNIESTINHMVHHRGQLTVYMRLNDILVPSIYGPSADDKSFGG